MLLFPTTLTVTRFTISNLALRTKRNPFQLTKKKKKTIPLYQTPKAKRLKTIWLPTLGPEPDPIGKGIPPCHQMSYQLQRYPGKAPGRMVARMMN